MLLIFFLTCLGIQSIYFILFTVGISKRTKEKNHENPEGVSIVVAAKNEIENLKKLIPELLNQSHENYETIVVNDRSHDETEEFLKSYSPKIKAVNITSTPDHINGKKYAITLGIRKAENDLILLTDADCMPRTENWVTEMASEASDKEIVLGFSGYSKKPGLLNYFIRFETIFTALQYLSLANLGRPYMGVGRNLAYRKSLFLENKGFFGYSKLVGGDDDLFVNKNSSQKNTAIMWKKDSQTISKPKTSLKEFLRQKSRHLGVGRYYKTIDKIILSVFSLTYLLSWLLLPWMVTYSNELYIVLGSFFFRAIIFYIAIIKSTKRLKLSFNVLGLPILDLLFVVYYCYTGLVALFSKRVTWN